MATHQPLRSFLLSRHHLIGWLVSASVQMCGGHSPVSVHRDSCHSVCYFSVTHVEAFTIRSLSLCLVTSLLASPWSHLLASMQNLSAVDSSDYSSHCNQPNVFYMVCIATTDRFLLK